MMIFGTRQFGRVNNTEHSYVTTNFFHINFVPLIPTSCWLMTPYGDFKLPSYHWPAVLHGYSKMLLLAMIVTPTIMGLIGVSEFMGGGQYSTWMTAGALIVIVALAILAFYGINSTYNAAFKGAHPLEEHVLQAEVVYADD